MVTPIPAPDAEFLAEQKYQGAWPRSRRIGRPPRAARRRDDQPAARRADGRGVVSCRQVRVRRLEDAISAGRLAGQPLRAWRSRMANWSLQPHRARSPATSGRAGPGGIETPHWQPGDATRFKRRQARPPPCPPWSHSPCRVPRWLAAASRRRCQSRTTPVCAWPRWPPPTCRRLKPSRRCPPRRRPRPTARRL
jgi:hypothetical protein